MKPKKTYKPKKNSISKWILQIVVSGFLLSIALTTTAQIDRGKIAYNWLYGRNCFTSFDKANCEPITIPTPEFEAGGSCVSISNPEGEVLFFGSRPLFNREFSEIPNSWTLAQSCDGGRQNIMAIPRPTSLEHYYLFTINRPNTSNYTLTTLSMSMLDMNMNDGLGGLQSINIEIRDSLRRCQTAVLHANKMDAWVIVHDWESNKFFSYSVTENGVAEQPVVSAEGEAGYTVWPSSSYMETSPDGTLLGFDLEDRAAILLADFDCSTGTLSNSKTVELGIGYIYSFQISREKRFLYVSKIGTPLKNKLINGLYQYDLMAGTPAQIEASEVKISETYYGDMLYGPDGKLYISKYGVYLDYITYPEKKGAQCELIEDAYAVPYIQEGLPIYIENYTEPLIFTAEHTCYGEITLFDTDYSECIDSVLWIFNDPLQTPHDTSTLFSPSFSFSAPGSYNICHISYRSSIADTAYKEVTIGENPQQYNIEGGGVYCQGGNGVQIFLDNSEAETEYTLYLNDAPTTNILTGSGAELNFGYIKEVGWYRVVAKSINSNCESTMNGEVEVHKSTPPTLNQIKFH